MVKPDSQVIGQPVVEKLLTILTSQAERMAWFWSVSIQALKLHAKYSRMATEPFINITLGPG